MKEKINTVILLFTRWATAIFLVDSIALIAFRGKEARLYAADVLVILALVCAILYVLLLSDRFFSKKKMLLMQFVYFIIIDALVLTTGQLLNWFSFRHLKTFLVFESVIIGAYLVTVIYSYKTDSSTARKMNEKLRHMKSED
ncbi:MAG: DUF3021 family protein [Treponema sp.]|nr:DUF3021 family protein [Treponema sp.]